MPLKIGITGGIGSGKSVICKVFRILEIPVFEADKVGKYLLDHHSEVRQKIINLFGESIYTLNDGVDRKKLASIIFNDNIALEKVNAIIHPAVREEFEKWAKTQNTPYLIHEAAILFESGFYKLMDFNIHVSAKKSLRIKRVMDRDNISEEMILARMAKQWPDEKKEKLADKVIYNNNELLIPQILKIDKQLKENGKIW